ncbi:uncharacterized protein NPIL_75551 [Nephila pilipes]|uniref:Uncharacterized protein n=1 Tax=Nephila pilipes TaxID=299642 RepID=A0A8X6PU05_NEPPI|nr:uncharacterized protein NPIL_75551 [Nephila pilipes]
MGLVSNTVFNGDFFGGDDLSNLCVLDRNRMMPWKHFQPKFDHSNNYSRSYMSLFTDLGRCHKDQDITSGYNEYKDKYTLFAIYLTPDLSADGRHASILRNAADLTWSAGLKFAKIELELFTDINLYIWIENSIRDGICFVGKRNASANINFIPEYIKYKEESYIIAVDAIDLFGYAMSQPLPVGNSFWLSKEVRNFDVFKLSSTDVIGHFLEVDILYPTSLHDLHDIPLAADHLRILYDMPPYQKNE